MTNLFWDKTGSKWDVLYNSNRSTLVTVGAGIKVSSPYYRGAFLLGMKKSVAENL